MNSLLILAKLSDTRRRPDNVNSLLILANLPDKYGVEATQRKNSLPHQHDKYGLQRSRLMHSHRIVPLRSLLSAGLEEKTCLFKIEHEIPC